ncbi:MAG: hypothetical protein ACYS26_01115 [Planctomycetota bacterium]
MNGQVFDVAVYDDGDGPKLYATGTFDSASGLAASNIARWNGSSWEALGEGIVGSGIAARALEVFDAGDGRGPGLYVAGLFSLAGGQPIPNVARFDGDGWSSGGSGITGPVEDLVVFDDGSGPALYAAGDFVLGVPGQRGIARLIGEVWVPPPVPFIGNVRDAEVYDSPQGPRLVLSGSFFSASGLTQNRLAQWDGSGWSDLGSAGEVETPFFIELQTHDDGNGERLYLTGSEVLLQAWDGSQWTVESSDPSVSANKLMTLPGVAGEELYGLLYDPILFTSRPARWNGSAWQAFEGEIVGNGIVAGLFSLGDFDPGALLVHGGFVQVELQDSQVPANSVARWSPGDGWSAYGQAPLDLTVDAQAVYDDGSGRGPELYVAGRMITDNFTSSIYRWRDGAWEVLVASAGGAFAQLLTFDWNGDGIEELIAGGSFTDIDWTFMAHLAAFDGSSWQELGGGTDQPVRAMLILEDGDQFPAPTLVVAGPFDKADNELHKRVAYWSGSGWGHFGDNGEWGVGVSDIEAYDRGDGPELYVTGTFTTADDVPAERIARWDGSEWQPVGTGGTGLNGGFGESLEVYDDGGGARLYVAGSFSSVGSPSLPAQRVASTDGFDWFAAGPGVNSSVNAIAVHDDGFNGPRLVAAGQFTAIGSGFGSVPANGLAIWDGSTWSPFEGEIDREVETLLSLDPGVLPFDGLLVGGSLKFSPGGDAQLARWGSAQADLVALPGCGAGGPLLTAGVGALAPGGGFEVFVTSVTSPLASLQLYVGAGLPGPCGIELPGLGELLLELAPFPTLLASGTASGGHGTLPVAIPNDPALVGQTATLQALALDLSGQGPAAELSQGLVGTL